MRNSSFYSDQYVQKVDTNGSILWGTKGAVVCTLKMEYETYPQITSDGLGGAICTWYGDPNHSWNHVWVQRIYSDGTPGGVAGYPDEDKTINGILLNIYPNPARGWVNINYSLPVQAKVKLNIYNTLGQKVRTLVQENQTPGYYNIKWDSKDDSGKKAAAGVYFYRLTAGDYSAIKKMVVLR